MIQKGRNSFPKVSVRLTERERSLLLSHDLIPDELKTPLRYAVVSGSEFEVGYILEDLGGVAGYAAAEAADPESEEAGREWDALYRKLVEAANAFVDTVPDDVPATDYMSEEACEAMQAQMDEFLDTLPPRLAERIQEILERGEFRTEEEFERQVMEAMEDLEDEPLAAIGGLTASQMDSLVESDWLNPGPGLTLRRDLAFSELKDSEFFANARILLETLAESGGTKTTEAGNLTRKFTADMMGRMRFPEGYVEEIREICKVINESDVQRLHIVRVILEQAGLIRNRNRKIVVTKAGKEMPAEEKAGEFFVLLLHTYFRNFNMAYVDSMAEFPGIQATVPYILWRLRELGEEWRRPEDLAEETLLEPVKEEIEASLSRQSIGWPFQARVLEPLVEFGLMEEREIRGEEPWDRRTEYRKTGLYDRVLEFEWGE